MTPKEAKQVLEVLARGIDPETGEVLAQDSPIHNPHVIRALFMAVMALEQGGDKPVRLKAERSGNAGKSWTPDEDKQLLAAFDAGTDVPALAKIHQRTSGAIKARLIRHGRLQPDNNEAV